MKHLRIGLVFIFWSNYAFAQFNGCLGGLCNLGNPLGSPGIGSQSGGTIAPSLSGNLFLVDGTDPVFLVNGTSGVCLTGGGC
jgi:hypothetical protein